MEENRTRRGCAWFRRTWVRASAKEGPRARCCKRGVLIRRRYRRSGGCDDISRRR